MASIEIRRLTGEDVLLLQQIGRKTFEQTLSSSNSKENMEKYLAGNTILYQEWICFLSQTYLQIGRRGANEYNDEAGRQINF